VGPITKGGTGVAANRFRLCDTLYFVRSSLTLNRGLVNRGLVSKLQPDLQDLPPRPRGGTAHHKIGSQGVV
jgi:hypothetical protein